MACKLLCRILYIFLLTNILALPQLRADVVLYADSVTAFHGDTIDIAIKVDGFTNVVAEEFIIHFDTAYLTYIEVVELALPGHDFSSFNLTNAPKGEIHQLWVDDNTLPQSVPNGSALMKIRCKVKTKDGHAKVTFSKVEFGDANLDLIPFIAKEGTVTIFQNPNVLLSVSSQPSTTCDAANANGILEAAMTGNDPGYLYHWYKGKAVKETPDYTGKKVENLDSGDYTLVVKIGAENFTEPELHHINFEVEYPSATLTVEQALTWCKSSNGILKSAITTQGYSFQDHSIVWKNNSEDVFNTKDTVVSGLDSGNYTLEVNLIPFACKSTYTVYLPGEVVFPSADGTKVASTASTFCKYDTYADGKLDASNPDFFMDGSINQSEGHHIYWMDNNKSLIVDEVDNRVLDSLKPGNYYVAVRNIATGCSTDTVLLSVANAAESPVVHTKQIAVTASTYCKFTSFANGKLAVNMPEGITETTGSSVEGYKIIWMDADLEVIRALKDEVELDSLAPGYYFLNVENILTGCVSDTLELAVSNESVIPKVLISTTPNTIQPPGAPNGTATATLQNASINNYSVWWWYGVPPVTGNPFNSGSSLVGLKDTTITVQVSDSSINCIAYQMATLGSNVPTIEISGVDIHHQDSCNGFNGRVDIVEVQKNNVVGALDEYGFDLLNSDGQLLSSSAPFFQLTPDIYYLRAKEKTTGYYSGLYQALVYDSVRIPQLSIVEKSSRTYCGPVNNGFDGSVTLTAEAKSGEVLATEWQRGEVMLEKYEDLLSVNVLDSGNYRVFLTNKTTGCGTEIAFRIDYMPVYPQDEVVQIGDTLKAPDGYIYNWFFDGNPLDEESKNLITTKTGDYLVELTNVGQCTTTSRTFNYVITGISHDITSIHIYPNPVRNELTVEGEGDIMQIKIYNSTGRVLSDYKVNEVSGKWIIDVEKLPSGILFLYIGTHQKELHWRIIKQ